MTETVSASDDGRVRCGWATTDALLRDYHDAEWGVPHHDDRALFELLILEGAQAGLSWLMILRKRTAYQQAFDNFDAHRIARYSEKRIEKLLANPGIVRNRLKVAASVQNAKAFLAVQEECGSFDSYLWQFTGGRSMQPKRKRHDPAPARTFESDAMSKDLMKRGFKFVGSTICYAFMQAAGLVNDHATECFRYGELAGHESKRKPAIVRLHL